MIHAVNLAEVYVDALRRGESKEVANEMVEDLENLGLEVRADLNPALWERAVEIKASGGIAFADCFALSLTERVEGKLYTADRKEMQRFAAPSEFELTFIR